MKKIGYLGMGSWGFSLAMLLASKGHQVTCWTTKLELARTLTETRKHPLFPDYRAKDNMSFTTNFAEVLDHADIIVESVTSKGIRPVFEQVRTLNIPPCPIVVTSKGIEPDTGNILPEVISEILGQKYYPFIGCLSGPSFAADVMRGLPTSIVVSGYNAKIMQDISDTFLTPNFRIYPNNDIKGVAFGGALKNIIGIACAISDGLALGSSSKAALMTRGLHEIRKLAVACGCKPETINGLSGMGDLCVTCSSSLSRNFHFGSLLAQGISAQEAQKQIGMVVEGVYACISAVELGEKYSIDMPIAESIYNIIYHGMRPIDAVGILMKRTIKEEHL